VRNCIVIIFPDAYYRYKCNFDGKRQFALFKVKYKILIYFTIYTYGKYDNDEQYLFQRGS